MAGFHLDNYIPQNVVIASVLQKLWTRRVFKPLVTTQLAVSLGKGQSYQIPDIVVPTVSDYTGVDITMEAGTDSKQTLTIDQAKYFNTFVDSVDSVEASQAVLPIFSSAGAEALADIQDKAIATRIATQAGIKGGTLGTTTTPIVLTKTNIIDHISLLKQKLDEADVPSDGRALVVPPFVSALIDVANISGTSTTEETARRTGFLATFLGFQIYMSNNLVVGTAPSTKVEMLAFRSNSVFEVEALQDMTFYSPEKRFGDACKALHVYGGEVVRKAEVLKSVVSDA